MPWGSVTITYAPTGYAQNYKRNNVITHPQAQALVVAAIADSAARIGGGVQVVTHNIRQNMAADPGANYRVI